MNVLRIVEARSAKQSGIRGTKERNIDASLLAGRLLTFIPAKT